MARSSVVMMAVGLIFVSFSGSVAAQINPTLTEAERGIRTGEAGEASHLRVAKAKVSIHVVGHTADVTLELLIGSDSSDAYEANLSLTLPADAVVTGYAIDVDGKLIAGRLLEQPKARNVYEDEVRQGIDPGLAEVSAGNLFTTRIYPIDSEHARRFRVSFVAPFDPEKGLVLPLSRDLPIDKVEATVTIDGYAAPPEVRFADKVLALTRDGGRWNGGVSAEKAVLRDNLSIRGGTLAAPSSVVQHDNGEMFFIISDSVKSAPVGSARCGRLRIYWDRSLSHRDDQLELETEVLARLVDTTAPSAIDLVTFASDRPQVMTLKGAAGLRAALGAVTYRGGTSLAGLDRIALPEASRCVMVFDGQVTIDQGAEFAPDCRLSIITSSTGANGARLGRITQHTNGTVLRLADGNASEAATTLAQRGIGIISVRDEKGQRLGFRSLPAAAGSWQLVGQMPKSGAVRVRLSDGSERIYTQQDTIVRAEAPGALWAAQRVNELGNDPSRHKVMADFARRYQIAGPAMAFLVLERADQYLRADIAPPVGFSDEWMQQYREAKKDEDAERADARRERLAFVLRQWQERKKWWNKSFIPLSRPQHAKRDARESQVMAPPPAVPSVAAAPPAPDSGMNDVQDIITTAMRRQTLPVASENKPTESKEIKLDLADLLSNRPYIAALNAAPSAQSLKVLGEQERAYGMVPTFYLDVAEWFRLKGDLPTADLLLLSALELPTSDDETRQIVAFRLERDKSYDRAVELTERLAAVNAEFRPQPGRDLALALAARGRSRGVAGRADLVRAFGLLTETALNPASGDFDGIEVVALMEANALIPDIKAAGGSWSLDKRLVGLLDTDARIVIEWTADDADIDLWVDEPNGERVYYGDKLSSVGGQISNDMTDGYGPEEYAIRHAPAGDYRVRINGYDADRINPNGPGHVLIRMIRNFARKSEQQVMVDADLSFQKGRNRNEEDEMKPIAKLHVGK